MVINVTTLANPLPPLDFPTDRRPIRILSMLATTPRLEFALVLCFAVEKLATYYCIKLSAITVYLGAVPRDKSMALLHFLYDFLKRKTLDEE